MSNAVETRQIKLKELIIEQMKKTPIVQIACSKCDIARSTYYVWIKEDENFAAKVETAIEEGTNIINDLAESQLVSLIKDGNMSAIFYWLNHRSSAYRNRIEVTSKEEDKELSDEQKELITKALKLASLNLGDQNGKHIND
ncbi:MAG: phBC6A51 family helix-turn-helix protein [Candidatus Berkelbacteria bacterium]